MSLYTRESEPSASAIRDVQDAAAYLDDVIGALADVGVRTDSVEIDARNPLNGRLVVAEPGCPETLVLEWHRDDGWWLARRNRLGTRPTAWRMLSDGPRTAAADVAGQFRNDLRTVDA